VKTAIHYQSELARHPSSLADFQTDVPMCLDFTASPNMIIFNAGYYLN
jgi:hypothetical protein